MGQAGVEPGMVSSHFFLERMDRILVCIPDDFDAKKAIAKEFEEMKKTFSHLDPLDYCTNNLKLIDILEKYIPEPEKFEWTGQIFDIFIELSIIRNISVI